MLICGPSLLPQCGKGSSVPFIILHGFQSKSNGIKNCKSSRTRNFSNTNNSSRRSITCKSQNEKSIKKVSFLTATFITAVMVIGSIIATADAAYEQEETLSNIPQTLSGECLSAKDCKKAKIQKPNSRKAESCTIKCVTTCIRGGDGSPGEGPLNVRRPLVVFKQGFRTRQYCLVECSDICNLISSADNVP